jgi:hypothetical protein
LQRPVQLLGRGRGRHRCRPAASREHHPHDLRRGEREQRLPERGGVHREAGGRGEGAHRPVSGEPFDVEATSRSSSTPSRAVAWVASHRSSTTNGARSRSVGGSGDLPAEHAQREARRGTRRRPCARAGDGRRAREPADGPSTWAGPVCRARSPSGVRARR